MIGSSTAPALNIRMQWRSEALPPSSTPPPSGKGRRPLHPIWGQRGNAPLLASARGQPPSEPRIDACCCRRLAEKGIDTVSIKFYSGGLTGAGEKEGSRIHHARYLYLDVCN